ncbi:MAG: hypothetical protein HZB35_00590 [Nitrospirae bacterium]|nr:hypothetical protein [Nitrospirota bacterium]
MAKQDTPEEVRQWFVAPLARLWRVAAGSLNLRKNGGMCPHCLTCRSGEGHPREALHSRHGSRRSVRYVPDELRARMTQAVANGRTTQALVHEAGRRYLQALKAQRRKA